MKLRDITTNHFFLMASVFIAVFTINSAHAANVSFSWLPNSEPNLSGYKVHYGTSPRNYTHTVDVGNPGVNANGRVSAEIFNLAENQTYFAAATAYDTDLDESNFSTEVQFTVNVSPPPPSTVLSSILEAGEVLVDHSWVRINFDSPFTDPIVATTMVTYNGSDPSIVRMRNVDSRGFEMRIQEFDYLNDYHAKELVSYLVMERGSHTLPDGTRIEAGTFDTNATSSFVEKRFNRQFNSPPVIITSITSYNGTQATTGRVQQINQYKFEYMMQEQEANSDGHAQERISYIAWERSDGTANGITYAVGSTGSKVNDNFSPGYYRSLARAQFTTAPITVAHALTTNGKDTVSLRIKDNTIDGFSARIQEETSSDSETTHTTEDVGYIAVQAQ